VYLATHDVFVRFFYLGYLSPISELCQFSELCMCWSGHKDQVFFCSDPRRFPGWELLDSLTFKSFAPTFWFKKNSKHKSDQLLVQHHVYLVSTVFFQKNKKTTGKAVDTESFHFTITCLLDFLDIWWNFHFFRGLRGIFPETRVATLKLSGCTIPNKISRKLVGC